MTKVRAIAQNTFIQIIGKAITAILVLAGFGVMTRYLGQEGFGFYTTVYAFLAIFGILIDLGLQMTTTQLISDPKEDQSKILSNALTIRLIASVVFLGLAPLAALFFPYPTLVKAGIALATLGFVFASLTSTLISLFQKNLIMIKVVIAEVIAKLIFLIILIAAVYFNGGLLAIIGVVVLDSFLIFVIMAGFARRYVVLKLAFDFKIWRKILGRTWPIGLTIALNLIYFKGDIVIMSLLRSQTEVGLYGAPYKFLEALINIAYLFLGLILPLMAAAVAAKNIEKLKQIIQSTFEVMVAVSLPMIIGGLLVGRPLLVLIAGAEFAVSGEIIKILLLATGAIFVAGLFGYAAVALNQQKRMIKFYALNAVISIIGYIYLIAKYSYWGAAWMTVATELFILLTAAYVVYQTINLKLNFLLAAKSLLASLIMGGFLILINGWPVIINIILAAAIYTLMLYLLKGFKRQLILEVIKIKKDIP